MYQAGREWRSFNLKVIVKPYELFDYLITSCKQLLFYSI